MSALLKTEIHTPIATVDAMTGEGVEMFSSGSAPACRDMMSGDASALFTAGAVELFTAGASHTLGGALHGGEAVQMFTAGAAPVMSGAGTQMFTAGAAPSTETLQASGVLTELFSSGS